MKKPRKNNTALISLLIMGIMFISVLSYAFLNVFGEQEQNTATEITGVVMKENLSYETRYSYMQQGMTFLEVHYDYFTDLVSIEDLPNQFKTPLNEIQLIVIEIEDNERQYTIVQGINGEEEINSTDINSIARSLCSVLTYPPVECVIDKLNTTGNSSSSIVTTTIKETVLSASTLPSDNI